MNIQNVKTAIAIMQRVIARGDKVCMINWQSTEDGLVAQREPVGVKITEEALHACGNMACFAGYVAISPEWRAAGGEVYGSGCPRLLEHSEYNPNPWALSQDVAIAAWLDITRAAARSLIIGDTEMIWDEEIHRAHPYSNFYNKWWQDVTAEDVIAKLEWLLTLSDEEKFETEE